MSERTSKILAWTGWTVAAGLGGYLLWRAFSKKASEASTAMTVREPQPGDVPNKVPPGALPQGYVWVYGDPTRRYYAGFSRPFFVTDGMVRSGLSDRSATLIGISPRSTPPRLVHPQNDPLYNDDWDEWLTADYSGKPGWFSAKRQWKWLMMIPKPNA